MEFLDFLDLLTNNCFFQIINTIYYLFVFSDEERMASQDQSQSWRNSCFSRHTQASFPCTCDPHQLALHGNAASDCPHHGCRPYEPPARNVEPPPDISSLTPAEQALIPRGWDVTEITPTHFIVDDLHSRWPMHCTGSKRVLPRIPAEAPVAAQAPAEASVAAQAPAPDPMDDILFACGFSREAIERGDFLEYKRDFLARYKNLD